MKRFHRYLDVLVIVLLLSLFVVPVALAQDTVDTTSLLAPFTPILAASAAIERLLQLIRNLISPDPEQGLLARSKNGLRYFTTIGGTVLGIGMAFLGNMKLLEMVGITIVGPLDTVLTGIVVGMGSEVVHELIKVIAEGKLALRASSQRIPQG